MKVALVVSSLCGCDSWSMNWTALPFRVQSGYLSYSRLDISEKSKQTDSQIVVYTTAVQNVF